MDGGSLAEYLLVIKGWLQLNPHEVVTLLFVNTGVPLQRWAKAYHDTGFDLISYVPPPDKRHGAMRIEDWPTISSMIATNQRAVTFITRGADEELAPFILPEFDYVFETNFGIESPDQYSCMPDRPRWFGSPAAGPRDVVAVGWARHLSALLHGWGDSKVMLKGTAEFGVDVIEQLSVNRACEREVGGGRLGVDEVVCTLDGVA
ncbi:hypothetical protein B0A49_08849 [Cryomyces minteri]|uniref:Uncharacterized protein n=1 Tax=Cryomyces minteri TaxID=331657 RepID=A0A4U0WKP2_9PEZI|nr:hypothetical protein B0A49_08849 [Cryomyces minteri]